MSTHQDRLDGLIKSLTSEDMLGAVIRLHLYIEYELNVFIAARASAKIFDTRKRKYSQRIDKAMALGLLPDLEKPLRKIGRIRNDFAHNLDHILSIDDVDSLFQSFGPKLQAVAENAYAVTRTMPNCTHYPETLQEMNGASKMQFYVMQVWALLARFNNPTFDPHESIPEFRAL